jgi:hypothetical protein
VWIRAARLIRALGSSLEITALNFMHLQKSLAFHFDSLECEGALDEYWQILLHVVADFSILVDSKVLYCEQQFCIVEFALALSRWLHQVHQTGEDFIYVSMESEEIGLVWVKASGSGWRVGSVHQEYEEANVFSLGEIKDAAEKFLDQLEVEISAKFRIGLREFISKELNAHG